MKTNKAVKIFAMAVLMPMLILAFAVAPAQAKSPEYKLTDNVKVHSLTIDLYQLDLTEEQMAMLGEMIPLDLLVDNDVQFIQIDGMAHVNMMVKEKKDNIDIDLHLAWHGTIALLDSQGNNVVALESKNIQLMVHASVPNNGDLSQADLWLNFHTNSVLVFGDGSVGDVALKAHVILSFSEGEFDLVKVQLPQFTDIAIF